MDKLEFCRDADADLESLVANLKGEMYKMQCALSVYGKAIAHHSTALSRAEEKNKELEGVVVSRDSVITELQKRIREQEDLIGNLQTTISTNTHSDQNRLEEHKNDVKGEIDVVKGEMVDKDAQINDLKDGLVRQEAVNGALHEEIAQLMVNMDTLAEDMKAAEQRQREREMRIRRANRARMSPVTRRETDRKLLAAAEDGKIEDLCDLLASGAEVNARDTNKNTALILASLRGRHAVVQELIEADAKVNTRNNFNDTALIVASRFGHMSVVRILLSSGANPTTQGLANKTALQRAIDAGHVDIVDLLRDAGARE